jgi:rhodanese-related sulfurtransferase
MGQAPSVRKVNFEDVQYAIKQKQNYLIINTLDSGEQQCLISKTIGISQEERIINQYLNKKIDANIIVYDKNANAPNLMKKYEQLLGLGFINVYIYPGGLFEWLLLQDVYGKDDFPTTMHELDILKYKGKSIFTSYLLNDVD